MREGLRTDARVPTIEGLEHIIIVKLAHLVEPMTVIISVRCRLPYRETSCNTTHVHPPGTTTSPKGSC